MPVSVTAKVHNSPAARPWARISIAIKAEGKASGTNLIVHRNQTAPDICQTFYAQSEVSNAISRVSIQEFVSPRPSTPFTFSVTRVKFMFVFVLVICHS